MGVSTMYCQHKGRMLCDYQQLCFHAATTPVLMPWSVKTWWKSKPQLIMINSWINTLFKTNRKQNKHCLCIYIFIHRLNKLFILSLTQFYWQSVIMFIVSLITSWFSNWKKSIPKATNLRFCSNCRKPWGQYQSTSIHFELTTISCPDL